MVKLLRRLRKAMQKTYCPFGLLFERGGQSICATLIGGQSSLNDCIKILPPRRVDNRLHNRDIYFG